MWKEISVKKYTHSFMLSEEEEQEWKQYVIDKMLETKGEINKSDIIREALFRYIRNGKPDPAKDAEQDAEQPAKNPFADINF